MVGEVDSIVGNLGNSGFAGSQMATTQACPPLYGAAAPFTRGAEPGPAVGWTRQPLATTLELGDPAAAGASTMTPLGQVGTVALTMDSYSPMQTLLHGYFSRYTDDANHAALEALVDNRAAGLAAMGHDEEQVRRNMTKADNFDWASAAAVGVVNATPFAFASAMLYGFPSVSEIAHENAAEEGALTGFASAVTDVVGTGLTKTGTSNTAWTSGGMEHMEPVMQEAIARLNPGLWRQMWQGATVMQPYTVRNVVRTAVAPLGSAAADAGLTAVGGLFAGAASGVASRYFDKRNGMDGPAFLFGRTDWLDLYTQLAAATWTSQAGNGLARAGAFPVDAFNNAVGAVRKIGSPAGLAETVLFTGGFAGIGAVRHAASHRAQAAGLSPGTTEFLSQLTNTALSAPLYAGLAPAMLGATHLAGAATRSIQNAVV